MSSEVSKLKSIDLENTVIRNPRVGLQNRPTSRNLEAGATGPNSSEDIYTGERDVNADYLIQASVDGNIVVGTGILLYQDDKITNVSGLNGLQPGDVVRHDDIIRMDGDLSFYGVTGIEGSTIWLQEKNTSFTGINPGSFQIRKNKLDSVYFEYIKSEGDENKFEYDKLKSKWTYTGVEPEGPIIAKSTFEKYVPEDPIRFKFLPSNSSLAPDLTHLDTTATDPKEPYSKKILQGKLSRDTAEISLNPIPYPDDNTNFKVYWGLPGQSVEKTKGVDYTVNYTSDPDFTSAKPPYEDRNTAYIFFMNELKDVTQVRSIGLDFEGFFALHESFVSDNSDEARAITNLFPDAKKLILEGDSREFNGEIIKIGNSVASRFFDYSIDYGAGLVNFIEHSNMEPVVQAVIHRQDIIWDGVSVIRGVGFDGLEKTNGEDLVIPYGIGLTGIDGPVFFEDTAQNNLRKDDDYIFEYESGAFRLNTPLKPNETVLVSYFTEGVDVEKEELNLSSMRTKKYPVIESSVSIKKTYTTGTTSGIKILIEGVDFSMHYLTGKVFLLNQNLDEIVQQLEITYTPFSQINAILQPIVENPEQYRITVVDDVLDTVDPFNLKFLIRNKSVSVPVEDPFGEEDTTYGGSIIPNSIQSIKAYGEPGYGLENLTEDQMYSLGITGLQMLGLPEKLGLDIEKFYEIGITGVVELGIEPDKSENYITTGYDYSDETKEISLDVTANYNKQKPDINDLIVATYSYEGDVLPYAPVQVIYPILEEGMSSFSIEGFDRTDTIRPGTILRIDNLTPKNTYYFKVRSSSYDGFNTTVELYGSFPEDINNPTFLVIDNNLNWVTLPASVVLDPNVSTGSDTLTFSGFTLETLNLIRQNSLMIIDSEDIYEILTVDVSNDAISVKIFPQLRNPFPKSVQISPSIYEVGDTDIRPFYPLVTDPEHPAFKIYYRKPENALYGFATIYIDPKIISLTEYVDGQSYTYSFEMSNYGDIRTLATAIRNIKSLLDITKYDYYPFSLNDSQNEEQYYLGNGWWSSNIVIPFEGTEPIIIPDEGYLVTISQEMFKYKLVRCYKDIPGFIVEEKDCRTVFSSGTLLALRDKAVGTVYYHEVASTELSEEEVDYKDNPLIHTNVRLKDKLKANMVDPYIYKYGNVQWTTLNSNIVSVSISNSKITLSSGSQFLRASSMIKLSDRYVYQIDAVSNTSEGTVLTLSPEIGEEVRRDQLIEVSTMPLFLDLLSPQGYFPVSYELPEGRSGSAYIEIDDDKIRITEELDGSSVKSYDVKFSQFNGGIVQLSEALERRSALISGNVTVNIDLWKDGYILQGNSLRLVPTSKTLLPKTVEVSKPAFRINYSSSYSGVMSEISIPNGFNVIQLKEWRIEDRLSSERTINIPTYGYSLSQIVSAINAAESLINTGSTPWFVDSVSYDSYYGSLAYYYDVTNFYSNDSMELPYTVNVTENTESWQYLGVLNRNVLVDGEDYSVEGTGVSLEKGIQEYERYELSYLGLDNLASFEGNPISATCRYFYSIPSGYEISVYMDFLNQDQYYIQKLTERRFIDIVSDPQIREILQQAGNSVGVGVDSGNDKQPQPWDGGLTDLYYALQDEKIKSNIYLKIFHWYKQRLRNFAAEAELTLGFKFGNCNFLGVKEDGRFTLENEYVENEGYTLTKDEDLDQIQNGFSNFFPMGYDGDAPQQYPRFGNEYRLSNEVFCFNIVYLDDSNKVIKREGRVIAENALLSDAVNPSTGFSDIDFDILPYTDSTATVEGSILRKHVFDFNEVAYNTIGKLVAALRSIKTSETSLLGGNIEVLSVESEQDYADRDPVNIMSKEGTTLPFILQMYSQEDGEIASNLKDVITVKLSGSLKPNSDSDQDIGIISDVTYTIGFKRLIITFSEKVRLYVIPYNKEEKIFRSSYDNFKFLKRVSIGDQIKLYKRKTFYKISEISRVDGETTNTQVIYSEAGEPILYDNDKEPQGDNLVRGVYTNRDGDTVDKEGNKITKALYNDKEEKGNRIPYYKVPKPMPPYERVVLSDGSYFTDKEVKTYYFKKDSKDGVWYWVKSKDKNFYTDRRNGKYNLQRFEKQLPKDGQTLVVKRNEGRDFPVPFVAWDDEFSLGSRAVGTKIEGHITGTDRIKKAFSFSAFFDFLTFDDEWFTVDEGTYDELTGEFVVRKSISINLKFLNLREERRVSDVINAVRYGLSGYRIPIVLPAPPFTAPPFFAKISNTYDKKDQRGADKYFYVDFDKYYDKDSEDGYEQSLIFRSRDRNTWFRFGVKDDDDVTEEYGFEPGFTYTNFYYPNNLYLKLLVEKQYWLAQIAIIKDLFDVANKVKRAFLVQEGPENISVSSGFKTLPFSEFRSYLLSSSNSVKTRLEAYAEHLRFLLDRSDTQHQYLVDNTSGPLYRTMMEDESPSPSIEKSYVQAAQAYSYYSAFEGERSYHWDINNLNNLKWTKDYCKWVLSLEPGTLFQEQAKDMAYNEIFLDLGFWPLAAIAFELIDYGQNAPFVVSDIKYRITFNILPSSDLTTDIYDSAYLQIQYKVSEERDYGVGCITGTNPVTGRETTERCFLIQNYATLADLIKAINTECLTPVTNKPVLRASCVFKYDPYSGLSTEWVLKNVRAVQDNDSNGPLDQWIALDDATVDSKIYVGNVFDHRSYDSRIFFLNRKYGDYLRIQNESNSTPLPGHSEVIPTGFNNVDQETILVWPHYVPSEGKQILNENNLGLLPVPGRWATDFAIEGGIETQDYTEQFNVLSISTGEFFTENSIRDYRFLDYAQGEEQLPGSEGPRNPLYEKSEVSIMQEYGYDYVTKNITSSGGNDNLLRLSQDSAYVKQQQPLTEVIRRLRVWVNVQSTEEPLEVFVVELDFDLRRNKTVKDLVLAINEGIYDQAKIFKQDGTELTDSASLEIANRKHLVANLIGTDDLQGEIKTVDLVTRYIPQEIQIKAHRYQPVVYTDSISDITEYSESYRDEPINKNYQVGWILREISYQPGSDIVLRVDPRTYSPTYRYRFIPEPADLARKTLWLKERKDTLAFDLYTWDDSAYYKILDNVLYLKCASIQEGECSISLLNENISSQNTLESPEKRLKLIELIKKINSNGIAKKKFFAHLRFGRRAARDYEYTYLPDTSSWYGGDGWVPIQKAQRDVIYLDRDTALLLNSEGDNAYYRIDPVSPYPSSPNSDTVYKSELLHLEADVKAFSLNPNTSKYSFSSKTYTVNQSLSQMSLDIDYSTTFDGSSNFTLSSYTVDTLAVAIDSALDGLNSIFSATKVPSFPSGVTASNLVQAPNNVIPGTLLANVDTPYSQIFDLSNPSYDTISEVINAINNISVTTPYGVTYPFNASNLGVSGTTPSINLDSGSGSLPDILTASSINAIQISLNSTSSYTFLTPSYSVSGGNLTLSCTVRNPNKPAISISMDTDYSGRTYTISAGALNLNWTRTDSNVFSHVISFSTATNIKLVVDDINAWKPNGTDVAFTASVSWIYPYDSSSLLLDVSAVSIISGGSYVRVRGTYDVPLYEGDSPRTLKDVVEEINGTFSKTGFSILATTNEYLGYKQFMADLLEPVISLTVIGTNTPLNMDFRSIPAVYVLNMSNSVRVLNNVFYGDEPATLTLSGNNLSCEKIGKIVEYTSFNAKSYTYRIENKDLSKLITDSMDLNGTLENPYSLSYSKGILKMDVALILAENVSFGILRNMVKNESLAPNVYPSIDTISLFSNDPESLGTHVYFGFLGDIRFWQISDYNLYSQYVMLKRRLGLPWDQNKEDNYVSNSLYNFNRFFNNLHENDKFLSYLKYTRFSQISDSIQYERIVQNNYLWLFLKLHRELGCDQRIKYLLKKIEEDEQKSNQLK